MYLKPWLSLEMSGNVKISYDQKHNHREHLQLSTNILLTQYSFVYFVLNNFKELCNNMFLPKTKTQLRYLRIKILVTISYVQCHISLLFQ